MKAQSLWAVTVKAARRPKVQDSQTYLALGYQPPRAPERGAPPSHPAISRYSKCSFPCLLFDILALPGLGELFLPLITPSLPHLPLPNSQIPFLRTHEHAGETHPESQCTSTSQFSSHSGTICTMGELGLASKTSPALLPADHRSAQPHLRPQFPF